MHWDIFCTVIDNHGDLGVCWRLACELAARGEAPRLWLDDGRALHWMAPQGHPGVQVVDWSDPAAVQAAAAAPAPQVLIEAFGCDPAPALLARFAAAARAAPGRHHWINLEYLSAEAVVEQLHGLPSPVQHGPGAGLVKRFFYPGFTPATGGLLREPGLQARRDAFDRAAWLAAQGIDWQGERLVSLFCYEPPALASLLAQLAHGPKPTRLLVTAGRATRAVRAAIEDQEAVQSTPDERGALALSYLPYLAQTDFDHLLWCCDLNFVRGEDSLVRALWAGAPFVWQPYPQRDGAHHAKLAAFLDWLAAPPALRSLHSAWNADAPGALPALDEASLTCWRRTVQAGRSRLRMQDDLVTQLARMVVQKG